MGDLMWYFAMLCDYFNIKFDDILNTNINKLRKRYPNGFETNRSINRGDKND